ncbi:MAG TPA: copper chaperone PCu(A)C [Ignavibacteriales bacterium]|nr:copper chaperone PCu(A)C [Ignavibacteriales bacterium]
MYIFVMLIMALPFMQQNGIEIKDAWIRPGAKDMNTALYFEIINHSGKPDTLYEARSNLAQKVEVHETYKQGDMMGMRPAKMVIVGANSSFKFQPGGHHVMFINLRKSLKKGTTGEVTLYFRHAGQIKITPEVRK